MNLLTLIDLHLFCTIFSLGVVFVSVLENKSQNKQLRNFTLINFLALSVIVLEGISVSLESGLVTDSKLALEIICFLNYITGIFVYPIMFLFFYNFIFKTTKMSKTTFMLLITPASMDLALLITNPFIQGLYVVGDDMKYARGSLFYIYFLVSMFYSLITTILVIANYKDSNKNAKISRTQMITFLFIILLPTFAGALQFVLYGAYLIWPILGLTLSTSHYILKSSLKTTDALTSAWSRAAFENYMDANKFNNYCISLINIDKLGEYNEKFGYGEGDDLIISFSRLIGESIPNSAFQIRYSSSTFMVFYPTAAIETIERDLNKLQDLVDHMNLKNSSYNLYYTAAYGVYNPNKHKKLSYLVKDVKKELYASKLSKQLENYVYAKVND